MNFATNKYFRFQIIFTLLFFIGIIMSIHLARNHALIIESKPTHPSTYNIFYWLDPTFAMIQTGNLIIFWGGALSCVAGVLVPSILKYKQLTQILVSALFIFLINLEFLMVSVFGTYIYEKIFIQIHVNQSISIIGYSINMLLGTYLFLLFWSLMGYGLKLSLTYKTLAIAAGLLIQIIEYSFIILNKPSLEKYLPFALSRQLVVSQFPFWEPGSWAEIPGTIYYASTPMIVDDNYNILSTSHWWIVVFLFWYLSLVYVLPIIRSLSISKEANDSVNIR